MNLLRKSPCLWSASSSYMSHATEYLLRLGHYCGYSTTTCARKYKYFSLGLFIYKYNKPSNNPLFYFLLKTFCLTKAYNFCHQVALVDGLMRRGVAIRWTNEKRARAVWECAIQIDNTQKSRIFSSAIVASNVIPGSRDPS